MKFLLAILLLVVGCSQTDSDSFINRGTETGDPSLRLSLSGFQETAMMDYFVPKAFAQVSAVQMCIFQIRFKADNGGDSAGVNSNFSVGLVTLDATGTSLGNIKVAAGVYRRIDMLLKDDCMTNSSLSMQNDNGSFTVSTPKTLRFEGEIVVDRETGSLELNIVPFINFFDSVTSDSDLQGGVQNISGSF